MNRRARLICSLLLVLLLFTLHSVHDLFRFEKFLNHAQITFQDFPSDYSDALTASQGKNELLQYNYSFLATTPSSSSIPPIIHFIWFRNLYSAHLDISPIPSIGSNTPTLCANHNPDFRIIIWNETAARDMLAAHYSWILPTYDSYRHPIQRVDAFKYFVLLHYGGVYMDLDISCRRPLDPLLAFPAWFPKASPLGVNNDLMAARPGHPVMKKMSETLPSRNRNLVSPYLTIFWSTGPQFTSDILKQWTRGSRKALVGPKSSHTARDPDAVYVLPPVFYSERYTFFGHRAGGTWHGKDVAAVLWLVKRPWIALLLLSALPICVMVAVFQARFRRRQARLL